VLERKSTDIGLFPGVLYRDATNLSVHVPLNESVLIKILCFENCTLAKFDIKDVRFL
jgi:hypothetical protein